MHEGQISALIGVCLAVLLVGGIALYEWGSNRGFKEAMLIAMADRAAKNRAKRQRRKERKRCRATATGSPTT